MPPPPTNTGKKGAAGAGAAAKGGASAAASSSGPKSPTSRPETRGLPRLPDAFWCRQDMVKVKAGAPIKLNVQFLPFALGDHKCQLVLLDDQVGEFMIDFAGVAARPALIETFRWTIENRTSIPRDFPVPFRNAQVRAEGRMGVQITAHQYLRLFFIIFNFNFQIHAAKLCRGLELAVLFAVF